MLRAIWTIFIALILTGACLLGLSQLALAVRGRAMSLGELTVTGGVLLVAIITTLLRKRRKTQRKYLDMRDSALW
ncbi:MAG: hypothetical protein ABI040_09915 [Rhodoferax sp.]